MTKDKDTPEPQPATSTPHKKRPRVWLCARIVDYRFQALAREDEADPSSDHCWTDVGPDTVVSEDREMVFQLGRAHGGLLLAVDGLPNATRIAALIARARNEDDPW